LVNYGPIAPEESRRIFAREALVYQRLQRRPDWVLANDAALREAQQLEERLRSRDLVRGAETFVDFFDARLPRQVSSAATLEHFSRHLTDEQRRSLSLSKEEIFARLPEAQALEQFPEHTRIDDLSAPVEYHFVPGDARDGANLKVPLLALPRLTRAAVDAAIPGLALPRVEALLRSLPKEARRNLIPVAETAATFLAERGAPAAEAIHLSQWLKETRGVPERLLRFDSAVPAHLWVHVKVMQAEREIAQGTDLAALRRQCAAAWRAELDRQARLAYGMRGDWRRFEIAELPQEVSLPLPQGSIRVFPALVRREAALQVRFEYSMEEAQRDWRDAAVRLARNLLERQVKDLAKSIAADIALSLSASPYMGSESLIDTVLQLGIRAACFGDDPAPRARAAFEEAVDRGRERLYPSVEEVKAMLGGWFKDCAVLRQTLSSPRVKLPSEAAEETRLHLRGLLEPKLLQSAPAAWLRQLPRYLKAEQRRWQRNSVRGSEPASVVKELAHWSLRYSELAALLDAELRWIPQLEELRFWIEEYRVSLYAQELKTLGPVSSARLEQRAAEIDAWLQR
jgi:ATP-dependent helicase HrpA